MMCSKSVSAAAMHITDDTVHLDACHACWLTQIVCFLMLLASFQEFQGLVYLVQSMAIACMVHLLHDEDLQSIRS